MPTVNLIDFESFNHLPWNGAVYWKFATLNRLLKLPRPKSAAGSSGYILGRRTSKDIESDIIDIDANADIQSLSAQSNSGINITERPYSSINNVVIIDDDDDDDEEDEVTTSNGDDDVDNDLLSRLSVLDNEVAQENDSSDEDNDNKKDIFGTGIDYAKLLRLRRKNTKFQRKKVKSPQTTAKMTTRYRFRDLLLGDFSFNDDGER